MKQIIRKVIDRKGRVDVIDLPEPHVGPDQVLVQNHYSLISTGTELSTLSKTPAELVKQTISDPWMRHVVKQTILATGLGQTAQRVWHEMTVPREIGYSGAGRVLEVGDNIEGIRLGSKVAYASAGHAELIPPTANQVVTVPESVELRHAAFVTVGGIAMHAIRRADVRFGEVVAVYGLGLVGQLCVSLAKAAGCVVVGIDVNPARVQLAGDQGADLVVNATSGDWKRQVLDFTTKHGVDATIICAASQSDKIINSSMEITRRQGRVVIVGYVNLNIHPKNFLLREIDLRYSRAFGPGSYDRAYESGRVDYPLGYVRWTEQRNLQEFIRLVAAGSVKLEPLIGKEFPLGEAQAAFDALRDGSLGGVAALIRYDVETAPDRRKSIALRSNGKADGKIGISIVGCGNHVLGKHLPNLRRSPNVEIRGLVSATGKNASTVADRVGATLITSDLDDVLNDPDTDGLLICSRQPDHYEHLCRAIGSDKWLYVEKPLVTRVDHFADVLRRVGDDNAMITLGLNRRYSPLVKRLREHLDAPVDAVSYVITQPYLPPDHWTLDVIEGGGRLITEGEHFLDLCNYIIGREPISIHARPLGSEPDDLRRLCNFAITVHYEQAVANILFNESGCVGFPREQVTVFSRAKVLVIDDFGTLTVHAKRKKKFGRSTRKEMGHREALGQFLAAIRGEPHELLNWREASTATLCMFAAQESIRSGAAVDLQQFRSALAELQVETNDDDE